MQKNIKYIIHKINQAVLQNRTYFELKPQLKNCKTIIPFLKILIKLNVIAKTTKNKNNDDIHS